MWNLSYKLQEKDSKFFAAMVTSTDQLGREITHPLRPQRIVSLVPSQTELLYYLGLQERVVGITKFCIHPESWFHTKTRVGGTKNPDLQKIRSLQPDLIIGNKEENDVTQITELMEEFPVWMSDISNLDEACEMIQAIGTLVQQPEKASELVSEISLRFKSLEKRINNKSLRVAYVIWKEPWMVAGSETFIDDLIVRCGCINVFEKIPRYPKTDLQEIKKLEPDVILLATEPYPFEEKHIAEVKSQLSGTRVALADGELFSWYGPRLLNTPEYLKNLLKQIDSPS